VRYGKRAPGAKNWNELYLQSRGAYFGTLLKSYLIQGAYFQFERYDAYENACRIRARLSKESSRLYEQVDALVFPVQEPGAAETLEGLYDQFQSTAHANVTGCPALAAAPFAAGRPCLQFVGALRDDARILALGTFLSALSAGGRS
jgi:aspartyl-tRNA(Asn)/glutamyl-tRNA(Gln) amidotransferase subunit A